MKSALENWNFTEIMALIPLEKYYGEYNFQSKGIDILQGIDMFVREFVVEAAEDLDVEIFILACSKYEDFKIESFREYDSMESGLKTCVIIKHHTNRKWFEISGNKSFSGKLRIDDLVKSGDLLLINSSNVNEFWGTGKEEEPEENEDCEDSEDATNPNLIYDKDALLIIPKAQKFKCY
jgi:hypothetical protein